MEAPWLVSQLGPGIQTHNLKGEKHLPVKGKKRKGQQRGNERVPAGEEDRGEGVKGEGGDDKEGEKEDEEKNEDTSSGDEDLAMLSLGEDISCC